MNNTLAIDVSYLRPSKTIETILLKNEKEEKVLYMYNREGCDFFVFKSILEIMEFFYGEFEPEIRFESEAELTEYLENLDLETITGSTPILR